MKTRFIASFLGILFLLSSLQCISDYRYEAKMEQSAAASAARHKYSIFVDIQAKTLYLLDNGECIKQYPIASGMSGLPSPLGAWKVVDKGDWGEGFGGSWLGLDVPCPAFLFGLY